MELFPHLEFDSVPISETELDESKQEISPEIISDAYDYISGEGWVIKYQITGSVYICDPPVLCNDLDFVVLVHDVKTIKNVLHHDGWKLGGSKIGKDFSAFRKGKINLIITQNKSFYDNYVNATEIAKKLNLLDKQDRINLFDAIIYKKINKENN